MELKEFVRQTIAEIAEGVGEAQQDVASKGACVNPALLGRVSNASDLGFLPTSAGVASILQFDVALSAKEGTDTKGGIGVVSGFVNLGSSGASNAENSSISRVQFNVPVALPRGNNKEDQDDKN